MELTSLHGLLNSFDLFLNIRKFHQPLNLTSTLVGAFCCCCFILVFLTTKVHNILKGLMPTDRYSKDLNTYSLPIQFSSCGCQSWSGTLENLASVIMAQLFWKSGFTSFRFPFFPMLDLSIWSYGSDYCVYTLFSIPKVCESYWLISQVLN